MSVHKKVLIAGAAVAAALLAFFLFRPPAGVPAGKEVVAGAVGPAGKASAKKTGQPAGFIRSAPRAALPAGKAPAEGQPPAGVKEFGPKLAAIPEGAKPLARVNGVDLTPDRVFPPGVMRPGDEMPQVALDKFIEDAVKEALVVQEAEKRGFAEDPEFVKRMETLKADVDELPNQTPEERAWQFSELRDQALMDRVFLAEGIVPRRLEPGEAEAYYQAHSAEYDWVRKRETLKGTPEDRIERRVMEEVRKDLMIPLKREYTARREAFTSELREGAEVEILSGGL